MLSTNVTESAVISGAIFSDIRTSLYSRMLELTKRNWIALSLDRFIENDTSPIAYMDWVLNQINEYSNKDVYMNPSYHNTQERGIFKYKLEPNHIDNRFLYYNLSPMQITWILQRISVSTKFFPSRFSLYCEDNIDNIIQEVYKKHESNPKTSNYTIV